MQECTLLVNEMVLCEVESGDIVGLNNISTIKHWYMWGDKNSDLLASLHCAGVFPTLIMACGLIFVGSVTTLGTPEDASRVKARIEASIIAA